MQVILHNVSKFFHTSGAVFSAEKSVLAALRKKTGYTFANCKKALEMHNNDLAKAEEWLKQQAQALGWSKATKLEGRQTTQGLVGVAVENNQGVLVEVNCETDFVARNAEFEKIVREATDTCLNLVKSSQQSTNLVTKIGLDSEQLKSLVSKDGKTLSDKLALMIGNVGENATLRRAVGIKVDDRIHLTGYAHPSGKSVDNILLGRIGGLIAVKSLNPDNPYVEQVAKGLCQHVVGMAPKLIGKEDDDLSPKEEEETSLLHQEYLLDDTLTVRELLQLNHLEVLDFERLECGENSEVGTEHSTLDAVEKCQ